jgi:hypothetical protein
LVASPKHNQFSTPKELLLEIQHNIHQQNYKNASSVPYIIKIPKMKKYHNYLPQHILLAFNIPEDIFAVFDS